MTVLVLFIQMHPTMSKWGAFDIVGCIAFFESYINGKFGKNYCYYEMLI